MKERKITEGTIVFDRNVKASELMYFTEYFCGEVIITKKLIVDKNLNIECSLYVLGDMVRKSPISECEIKINGDFYCYGDIHCNNISVSGCFTCEGIIYAKSITVGEDFVCYDKVDAYGCTIAVGGNLEAYSVKAESIIVINSILVYGSISAKFVKV